MNDQEINELVAKKLGWRVGTFKKDGVQYYAIANKEDKSLFFDKWGEMPDYCCDIKAAWEVVDSLNNHSVTVIKSNPLANWYCNIFSWQGYPNSEKQPEIEVEAETAPMAICLAFLKLTENSL